MVRRHHWGRVTRVLNLIGWRSADRSIETGSSTLGTAAGVQGRSALDHLLAVEQTEQGRVFVSGDGKVTFYGRTHETTGRWSLSSTRTITST